MNPGRLPTQVRTPVRVNPSPVKRLQLFTGQTAGSCKKLQVMWLTTEGLTWAGIQPRVCVKGRQAVKFINYYLIQFVSTTLRDIRFN